MNRFFFTFMVMITCQSAGAQNILTPNGYVPESELNVGDKVIGYDNDQMVINTIMEKRSMSKEFYSQQNEGFDFYVINNRYKFFSGQSIYANGDVIHVSELKRGDEIYNDRYGKITVNKILRQQNEYGWIRFIISGNHSYVKDGVLVHNASRFWVGGGSSANWTATSNTNWSATSGGSNNASVPTSADDVTFDGAGGSGNTNSSISATITVLSFTVTSGYSGTITWVGNSLLSIASGGSISLGANATYSGIGTAAGLNPVGTCSLTSNGKTWPLNINCSGLGTTKTFVDNWTVSGLFTSNTNGAQTYNGSIVTLNGGLTPTNTAEAMSGTTKFVLAGGTWGGNGLVKNNLDIAGNVTIGTNCRFSDGTITYVSGAVTTTGSLITFAGTATTINTGGITWNNITIAGTATYTLNSLLTAAGTMTINNGIAPAFAGTSGWTVSTFLSNHLSSAFMSLKNGVTYTITSAFNCNQSRVGSIFSILSDDATNKAILTLNPGASCSVLANFTRIDASNGRTIYTYNGTVTSCLNINPYTDLKTVSKTFVQ